VRSLFFKIYILLLVVVSQSLFGFDSKKYFEDSFYGKRPVFFVVNNFAGLRWDYIYGFGKNNIPYPTIGNEYQIKIDNPAKDRELFFKIRLGYAGLYSVSDLDISHRETLVFRPFISGYLGYIWTLPSKILFIESLRPFFALGPGAEFFSLMSCVKRSDIGAIKTSIEGGYFFLATQLGLETVIVKHLLSLTSVLNISFGGIDSRFLSGFYSTSDLSLGIVLWLR